MQAHRNPDPNDCCPKTGCCSEDGILGTSPPREDEEEPEVYCIPLSLKQIRQVGPLTSWGDCAGNWISWPLLGIGNAIVVSFVTIAVGGTLACAPCLLYCPDEEQITENKNCMKDNATIALRSYTALATGATAPVFLTYRTLRTVVQGFKSSMSNNSIRPNSQLNAARINSGYGPPVPNNIMPNPHLNPPQANPPVQNIISKNEFISKLKKLQHDIEEKGRISANEFLTPFENLVDYKQRKVIWATENSKDLTLALLEFFSTALSPYSTVILDSKHTSLLSHNLHVETCVYSASVIRKAITAIDFIKHTNPEISEDLIKLTVLKKNKEEEISKPLEEKSQIINPRLLHEDNNFQNLIDDNNNNIEIERLEKSIEEFEFQFKKSLTLSILDYFGRPHNTKKDFKNILTLFLFLPNPLENNLNCMILSCLKGYLSNSPHLDMGIFQKNIIDQSKIKFGKEQLNKLLINHLKPNQVRITKKDPLVI